MSSKKVKRLGLQASLVDKLQRQNIFTCKDVLSKTELELIRLLGTSKYIVQDVIAKACQACAPKPISALEIWRSKNGYLPTSLQKLDEVLRGGIPLGTITEFAGPSGCGKTQFSLMLSLLATLPVDQGGLGGAVVYIDTESAFSAERLVEMAQARLPKVFNSKELLHRLTEQVHVFTESTCASLQKRLEKLEDTLITQNIKLVVLDSVASLVRKEFDSCLGKNMIDRTNLLAKQAAMLKYIAEEFNIPIVVTNQITTKFGQPDKGTVPLDADQGSQEDLEESLPATNRGSLEGESGYVTAALGNTWSHSVNTRLILQYLDGPRRQVMIAKSPIAPFAKFVYRIGAGGVELEPEMADKYEGTDPGLQNIRVRTELPQQAFSY